MKDQLPNLRLLGLPSSEWGRDWGALTSEIDQLIEDQGFELGGQDILIEFNQWPQLAKVMIYRSVIGPLKEIDLPFTLVDWESSAIERFDLKGSEWNDLFEEIAQIRRENDLNSDFIIKLTRRFQDELIFNKQVLFR